MKGENVEVKGFGRRMKGIVFVVVAMMATAVMAFQPIPKESAKALGMTRGKPFVAGVEVRGG